MVQIPIAGGSKQGAGPRDRQRPGFTLIELLVVIGIILVLVSIAVPVANSARQKAKDTEVKAGCNTIQKALEQYGTDHAGQYPGAHWVQDSNGQYLVGPGLVGGTPTYSAGVPNNDFYTPKDPADPRAPFLPDGTPDPQVLDSLAVGDYLEDYPANPFLRASDGVKSQMSNLFLFNPILGTSPPSPGNPDTLDWDRYTAPGESMRSDYLDVGRGHFSYIPLNPVNNTGFDFINEWTSGNLTDAQLSEYYRGCRGYILAGWGHDRLEDSNAKGISMKYWDSGLGGFDFDKNLAMDQLERIFSIPPPGGIVATEMEDSSGAQGAFGGALPNGGFDFDQAFFGATFLTISGS
jgi:prepilin-type N-terminal cleavage/methylation domain-containing protein